MVRLVNDDEIELALDEALGVLAPPCGGDRSHDAILGPKRLRLVAQERVISGRECKTEFGLQFFAPLADERSRREDQNALGHAAQRIFLEYHARFDRLAEPDLIGKQNATTELLEHLAHRFDLMQQGFDAGKMRQAQELVEALRQTEMGEPFAQAEPAATLLRVARQGRQQRRHVELDRKRNVDIDARQGWRRGCDHYGRGRRRFARASRHFGRGRGPWLAFDVRRQASPGEGNFATYDIIELLDQPRQALGPARKSLDGRPPAVQAIALQQRSGCGPFAELVERQRVQEISRRRRGTFGKSLQED